MKNVLFVLITTAILAACPFADEDSTFSIDFTSSSGVVEVDGSPIEPGTQYTLPANTRMTLEAFPNTADRIMMFGWYLEDYEFFGEDLLVSDNPYQYFVKPRYESVSPYFQYQTCRLIEIVYINDVARILFYSNHGNRYTYYSMNTDGTDIREIPFDRKPDNIKIKYARSANALVYINGREIVKHDLLVDQEEVLFTLPEDVDIDDEWAVNDDLSFLFSTYWYDEERYKLLVIDLVERRMQNLSYESHDGSAQYIRSHDNYFLYKLWYSHAIYVYDCDGRIQGLVFNNENLLDFELSPDNSTIFYREEYPGACHLRNIKSGEEELLPENMGEVLLWSDDGDIIGKNLSGLIIYNTVVKNYKYFNYHPVTVGKENGTYYATLFLADWYASVQDIYSFTTDDDSVNLTYTW